MLASLSEMTNAIGQFQWIDRLKLIGVGQSGESIQY